MSMPSMDSNNFVARLTARIVALETALRELRAASGTLDAATIYKGGLTVIDPADNGRLVLSDGELRFWDDYASNPAGYGGLSKSGARSLLIYPPHVGGSLTDTVIAMIGTPSSGVGGITLQTNGLLEVSAGQTINLDAAFINIGATSQLRMYPLPTTGSAANLRKDPTTDQIFMVASSRRYKEDVDVAVVDVAEVLQLQPRTWVDKGTAERMAEAGDESDIPRNVGFIAEELDEHPSLRQFVDYIDLDGELVPDAIQYDRLAVGLVEVAKAQQTQLDAQATAIADLTTRLEALEKP